MRFIRFPERSLRKAHIWLKWLYLYIRDYRSDAKHLATHWRKIQLLCLKVRAVDVSFTFFDLRGNEHD